MANKTTGFSLLELIITLATLAILAGIAAPAFSKFLKQQSVDAQVQSVSRLLNSGRELAVTTGREMSVCGVNAGRECDKNNISRLAVYEDLNANKRLDSDEPITRQIDVDPRNKILMRLALGRHGLVFDTIGATNLRGGIVVCSSSDADIVEKVTINRAGRIYLALDRDGDGRADNLTGDTVECS